MKVLASLVAAPTIWAQLPRSGAAAVARRTAVPVIQERIPERFQSIPFESQQLGGLFAGRMRVNVARGLLSIDETAHLSGFVNRPRERASGSLPPPGAAWLGEHVGKWLDAASCALRYDSQPELRAMADRMVRALIATQEPDGYLGTYAPNQRWSAWDVWTHKYNLIGLLSYYELTGDAEVLTACRKIGDLLARTFGDAPDQRDIAFNADIAPDLISGTVAGVESTSVLEPLCALYRYTGEARYLELARYVVRAHERPGAPDLVRRSIDPDHIARGKAYEMLSNLVGLLDLYRLTGDESLLNAVMRDWEDICRQQLYITGTVASHENFQRPGELLSLFSSGVGENCATVTWLQLNWRLLRLTGEARFGQEIERTVYNQLLAAHDPSSGGFSYHTSLTGKKEFLSGLVCCVSSGKRGLALLPQLVWGLEADAFVVNLYTAGHASFERQGSVVRVLSQTAFPEDGRISLTVNPEHAVPFTMRLRVPEWTTRFVATLGTRRFVGTPGQMLDIFRTWKAGDTIQIEMDMPTRVLSGVPAYPDYVALQRGPQVLAMERSLNSEVPFLHRTALESRSHTVAVNLVRAPRWHGQQVYTVDAVAGVPGGSAELTPTARKLLFVPYADALQYRVWTLCAGKLRHDVPAVSAFARAWVSPDRLRPGVNRLEAITDEDAQTLCTCDPTTYGGDSIVKGALGKRGDPVSFNVVFDQPATVSRVVFRHGVSTSRGGWFDTSQGKPRVEVLRGPVPVNERTGMPNLRKAQWERLAEIEDYPAADAFSMSTLEDRKAFEIRLPHPQELHGIRVVGRAGGDYAGCAELSAYQ